MTQKTLPLTEDLYHYFIQHSVKEHPLQKELREDTSDMVMSRMATAPEQGQLLALLVKLLNVKRYLEIGVFTGGSSLAVGLNLPSDASIVALERREEYAEIAQVFWDKAGFSDRVDLRIGPAVESLAELESEGAAGSFDLAFIDADKPHYPEYYESCLRLVKKGGLIIIDNVFWHGNVAKEEFDDKDTESMREFNKMVYEDERVQIAMLPLGDGMTLAYVR
ncbi:class I SAM-dependent methyltransferase [Leeia sp. TBRC 13508]|uniref:Class I SAM-dependent methyltransferase n=1 Tax=Leeia speluncae TaxID=2884804 RepID=A0ABS8D6F7_9NEIS|nr:class I SAM-dependent methyltransferase [Leeia speluncae]MCB6183790.1 class I SAM-dependent methyltransferase [Leeia speluncae]